MSAPQQVIGHYRIVSKLGEGGMGEVWRATDTRLNREVAIKVLPEAFATDPMRMGRFAREAQVLASLNHPGIAAIYGVEERALVMELVEGPTLAEKIPRSGMPIEDALPIALQIAEALEYAHEKGVIHRDLKPANIKITPEGRVKILDFGLAKAMSADSSASAPEAATLSSPATMAGTILGTAAYMSPEQARGQNVDRRADIWAFGVVLYEMLTGERPFGGPTVSDTLAGVLKSEPDLGGLPAAERPIVERCLRKDPRRRWHAIGDARIALEEGSPAQRSPPPRPRVALAWSVAAAGLLLAIAMPAWLLLRPQPPLPLLRFTLAPPPNSSFTPGMAALSPDGHRLLFGAFSTANPRIWLQPLDATTAEPVPGTEGAGTADGSSWSHVFWSPDGRSVGFFAHGSLQTLDLSGGAPTALAATISDCGASWGPGNVILYGAEVSGPIMHVSAFGGAPAPATALDVARGETRNCLPWFLPDGRHFLYDGEVAGQSALIRVGSLDSPGVGRVVTQADSNAIFDSGYLLYLHGQTLMAQPFDLRRLITTGPPLPIADGIASGTQSRHGFFQAAHGDLIYEAGAGAGDSALAWFDAAGKRTGSAAQTAGQLIRSTLAPDGRRAVVTILNGGGSDLWIYDVVRNVRSRFTFNARQQADYGLWSPDGKTIAFAARDRGHFALYLKPSDGSGTPELLYAESGDLVPLSWSPDGKNLLYLEANNIWYLPLTGTAKPRQFLQMGNQAQFSPDGRWVAYGSARSGTGEVYVTPFPGPGGTYQVSEASGGFPRWSPDGKRLYYEKSGQLMAAEINLGGNAAEIGAVRPLSLPVLARAFSYDIAGDGQKFLVIAPDQLDLAAPLTFVQHWTAALPR